MLVWGGINRSATGQATALSGGAAYDPRARTWRRIAKAPKPVLGGGGRAAAWTGSRMVVYVGNSPDGPAAAAMYDPALNTWKRLPPGPLGVREGYDSVWTGKELLVFGGFSGDRHRTPTAAALNPARGAWRRLTAFDAVVGLGVVTGAVWDGRQAFVAGQLYRAPGRASRPVLLAFDPKTNRLREIDLSKAPLTALQRMWLRPLGRSGADIVFAAGTPSSATVIVRYNVAKKRWRKAEAAPCRLRGQIVWAGGGVIAGCGGGQTATYRPRADRWTRMNARSSPLSSRQWSAIAWTGTELVVWSGWAIKRYNPTPADGASLAPGRALGSISAFLLSGAAAGLTASGVRIADHAGHVRATVDFAGRSFASNEVEAADPQPFDGTASLVLSVPGVRSAAAARTAHGLRVRVVATPNRLQIVLAAARRHFKYLSYAVLAGHRLAIDLWKSAPPPTSAQIRQGRGRCLTLTRVAVRIGGRLTASGRESRLFEHRLRAVVRGADGRILDEQALHSTQGRWGITRFVSSPRDQVGTLEAVALSPKDGALACLVEQRVRLPFTAPAPQRLFRRAYADVDGDGRPDLITLRTASWSHPGGLIRVRLATGRVLSVKTSTFAVGLPALVRVGNVDGRPGDELFVDVDHISTNDGIGLYTYDNGQLRLAGGAPVSAHPGLFAGMTCGAAGSQRSMTGYVFVLKPDQNPRYWTRADTTYVWQGPRLVLQAAGQTRRIAGTPPPGLVGVRCGHIPATAPPAARASAP